MTIYVASSWKNPIHPEVVKALRAAGHTVYDYRNPKPGDYGFSWDEIDPNWRDWTCHQWEAGLKHAKAQDGFWSDFYALEECECVVGLIPFGASAGLEIGWALGQGKKAILLHTDLKARPDLMVKMIPNRVNSIKELVATLHAMR